MAGNLVADTIQAASTSTLVLKNGVANTPPTIQDSAGTQIGTFCRAWVNFNGTGTVAIRAAFNVSSITDNGVGDYTVNLTTSLPDTNYAAVVSSQGVSGNNSSPGLFPFGGVYTVNAVQVWFSSLTSSTAGQDKTITNVSIFR